MLLTDRPSSLLPTIRSRCQPVYFGPLPDAFVVTRLVALGTLADAQAEELGRFVGGRLGVALALAEDGWCSMTDRLAAALADADDPLALAEAIEAVAKDAAGPIGRREADLSDAQARRRALEIVFETLTSFYRDALLSATGADLPATHAGRRELIDTLTHGQSARQIGERLARLAEARRYVVANANPTLVVETLAADLLARPAATARI